MATFKDEQEIPRRQGEILVAAALGHKMRIRQSGGDPAGMGSFTYATMEAQEVHKLTIISVYRPCAGNAYASGGTIWKQQWARAQNREMGQDYDPRTAVVRDLGKFLENKRNHDIIIGGDFNGAPMEGEVDKEGTVAWLMGEFGLMDAYAELNDGPSPRTYRHGSRHIDQIYISDLYLQRTTYYRQQLGISTRFSQATIGRS